jgi:hypothetical protein
MSEVHMYQKRIPFFLVAIGALLIAGSVVLITATPVSAQCGSQASSCKNCHETQAQDPVNADGTTWHSQHAFGDFCYLCHAGNNQAVDKDAAHTGMVAPLSDAVASCKGCHANDYMDLAQGYATTLGVTVGTGAAPSDSGQPAAATPESASAPAAVVAVPASDMVDYSQRYDETVLGQKPVNWGNVILIVMILAMALGGGFLVFKREGLMAVTFGDARAAARENYSNDVLEMLPAIARLSPSARKDLRQILSQPALTKELFSLAIKLSKKDDSSSAEEK